ncbi:class II aldolase/adducin family protein [Pseudochelatococcus sp. B33]
MNHRDLREKIVISGHILVQNGQDDLTRGHMAVRLPDNPDHFLMKPHSVGLDELVAEDLLICDLDGNVVSGTARRHSEVFIHTEILKARPDVNAVLHTHPTYCVALSATGRPLRPVSQPAALFHGSLGLFEETITLIRKPEQGKALADALGGNRAVLMKHHGIACTGSTLEECIIGAIMLENAAQIQLAAEATSGSASLFPEEDIAALKDSLGKQEQFTINFDYLARRARRALSV